MDFHRVYSAKTDRDTGIICEPRQREDWRSRLDALNSLQTRLPAWLAQNSSANELANSVSGIASRLNSLASDSEHLFVCDQFLAALAADDSQVITRKEAWAALPKPGHPIARMTLEASWQNRLASLSGGVEPTSPSKMPKSVNSPAVAKLLDQLENKVAQGKPPLHNGLRQQLSLRLR
jgi:hypothetical protein